MAKPAKDKTFDLVITLDNHDAHTIMRALDLYMRVQMGQLDCISSLLWNRNGRSDDAEQALEQFRRITFPEFTQNASYGIRECPYHDARRAYDIYQAIRHREAWTAEPNGGMGVNFDEPFQVTSKPLPEVEAPSLLERMAQVAQEPKPKKRGARKKRK